MHDARTDPSEAIAAISHIGGPTTRCQHDVVSNLGRLFVAMLLQEAGNGVGGAPGHAKRPPTLAEDGAWRSVPLPADGMSALIDDILGYARGRVSGGLPIHLRPVADLADGLDGVVRKKRAEHADRTVIDNIEVLPSVHCDHQGRTCL